MGGCSPGWRPRPGSATTGSSGPGSPRPRPRSASAPATPTSCPPSLAENAAVGNDFAALFAAATLGIAAGFTGDPDSGLRWTEELLHRAAALGNHDVGDMLEQRGGHLAAAGRPDDAVRTFSASAARQRRVGRRWPRTDGTAELLDRLRDRLGTSRFALAWRAGAHLDLTELVPELTGPGQQPGSRAAR